MVLIPSYLEIDGLIVPLRACRGGGSEPPGVRVASDDDRPLLAPLMYAVGSVMDRADAAQTAAAIAARQKLPTTQQIVVMPITEPLDEKSRALTNYELLTGRTTDLSDAYFVAGSFTESLAIPRSTFAKMMAKIYELDAEVAKGRMEVKIDESMLIPPPLPEPPGPPAPRWEDDEIPILEQSLRELDQLDPLTDAMTDPTVDAAAMKRRPGIFRLLEHSWNVTRSGEDDLPARYRQLELQLLEAYARATAELYAYLHDPERIAITRKLPPHSPFRGNVSVDLFRHPEPPHPVEYSRHVWLAHAEAAFVDARQTGNWCGGDMFTRIGKYTVRMRYRYEVRHVTQMWRVELA